LRLDVVGLELGLRRLVSDWRRLNRVVVWHMHGILHLLVESWHVLVVLVCLRVRNLHRWHLTPDLVLRHSYLVEIRLLLRLGLVLWVGQGLSGSEAWVLRLETAVHRFELGFGWQWVSRRAAGTGSGLAVARTFYYY